MLCELKIIASLRRLFKITHNFSSDNFFSEEKTTIYHLNIIHHKFNWNYAGTLSQYYA